MNVTAHKFQSLYELVCKSSAWRNHRTTLPQSARRADSSLREGAGVGLYHSIGCSLKSGVAGDFHRPYENSEVFTFHHSIGCLRNRRGYGRFSSPLRKLRSFYILQFVGMGAWGRGADSSISDRNFGKMLKNIWSIDRKAVLMVEYSQKKRHFACEQIEKRMNVCQEIHRRISGQRLCGGSGF